MNHKTKTLLTALIILGLFNSAWAFDFEASVANGKALYAKNCASCHGASGEGAAGPAFNSKSKLDSLGMENFKHSVEDGVEGTSMPAWKGELTDAEISDVVNFIFAEWAEYQIIGIEMWPWEIAYVVVGLIWALMGLYYVIKV